jgi:hypothetical protein
VQSKPQKSLIFLSSLKLNYKSTITNDNKRTDVFRNLKFYSLIIYGYEIMKGKHREDL